MSSITKEVVLEKENKLFSKVSSESLGGSGHKLQQKKFHLLKGGKFFTVRAFSHCNKLPRKVESVFEDSQPWEYPDQV